MVVQHLKNLIKAPLRILGATLGRHRWPVPSGGRLLVLTYHRVLPMDHPDRSCEQPGMIVSPETLEMHCQQLARHFELIHLDEWLERQAEGALERKRYCALTFDDGWKDNYDYAFPVLQSAQVPATFFLVVGQVGTSYEFWPNRMARQLARGASEEVAQLTEKLREIGVDVGRLPNNLSLDDINYMIEASKVVPDAAVSRLLGDESDSKGARDLMNWSEIREMAATGLAHFGSHTLNHTRLVDGVDLANMEAEVRQSKSQLEEELNGECVLFCFPNGDCNGAAMAYVRECYNGAVSTDLGWNRGDADPFWLRRVGVHDDIANTPVKFLSRIGGFI